MDHVYYQLMKARHDDRLRDAAQRRLAAQARQTHPRWRGRPAAGQARWASATAGPVSHYLGLLATVLGRCDEAAELFSEAADLAGQIGALPSLAHARAGLADALASRAGPGDIEAAGEQRRQARSVAERLGMTVLLAALSPPAGRWRLRRDGGDWLLDAGDEHARLRDGRGLHYLRALLAAPGHDIPALDLAAGGAGVHPSATGPAIDEQAAVVVLGEAQVAEVGESARRFRWSWPSTAAPGGPAWPAGGGEFPAGLDRGSATASACRPATGRSEYRARPGATRGPGARGAGGGPGR